MKITEIAFTGYSVVDMKRARMFYEGVLGLTKLRAWGEEGQESWIEYDIGPGCLALVVGGKEWPPSPDGTAAALEVDDLDAFVAKVTSSGAKILVPMQDFPPCRMFVAADPDGNRIMFHQRKPQPAIS
jgi:predicted enzyme related to lactoylglutathione lyase